MIKSEFKIINEEKKIIINNYKEIKLQNEIKITDHELIKLLIDEIRELKDINRK